MFLFEYVIKLLMGNSDSIFVGLVVVVFGYYGWLLWNINSKSESYLKEWDSFSDKSDKIIEKLNDIEKMVYRDITKKSNDINTNLDNLEKEMDDIMDELTHMEDKLLLEINEESDNLKETMSILLKCYRNINDDSLKGLNEEFKDKINILSDDENDAEKEKGG